MAWRRGVVAWARAIYQYRVNGMDMVGRLADTRGPVDYASVGLAQICLNYIHNYLHHKCLNLPRVELLWNFAISPKTAIQFLMLIP